MEHNKGIKNNGEQPGKNGSNIINFLIIGIALTFIMNFFMANRLANQKVQIEYSQFIQLVENGLVRQVQVEEDQIALALKEDANQEMVKNILNVAPEAETAAGSESRVRDPALQEKIRQMTEQARRNQVYYTGRLEDPGLTERLLANNVPFYRPIVQNNPILSFISSWVIPILIFYVIYYF
ncbi:ATP-dependent metallopeptidase FtsH/Yme1/Tma family protein, partial [Treponema sp. OttesenSCG-928-L16]|nr:ATP-dependent metallopeptidase FtsH/Yme1/Tma family protein [Treponema sp. OttesenSCG-928-L16]